MGSHPATPTCISLLRSYYPSLTAKERVVASYIMNNNHVIRESITHVARECKVSYGTIDRLCKRLGLSGFQELKIRMASEHGEGEPVAADDTALKVRMKKAVKDIQQTVELLSEESLNNAAKAIADAGSVLVCSLASSLGTAVGVHYRLSRFGIRSDCPVDTYQQRYRATTLTVDDVALVISYSGASKELLRVAQLSKRQGAKVIALSNYLESPITEEADILLLSGIESNPMGEEVASKVAMEFIVTELFERIFALDNRFASNLLKTFTAAAESQM